MMKTTMAQLICGALALAASSASMAGNQFYGAISYGEATTNGDDTINYALFDATCTDDYRPLGGEFGNSGVAKLKLGMRFENKMFLELAGDRVRFDGTAFGGNGGTNDCTIAPSAGLIEDCFDDATLAFDSEVKNTDLVFGWGFNPSESWSLQPYIGLRRVDAQDSRVVEYLYDQTTGGFNDFITDSSQFKKTGFIAGLRAEKTFGQWFYSGDFSYSRASGTRTRSITDIEYTVDGGGEGEGDAVSAFNTTKAIPDGADITDTETSITRDNIAVRQWNARFAFGHRFKMSENNHLSMSIGYNLGSVNGFDTRDTNPNVAEDTDFIPGSLGSKNAELKSRGFDLTIGWNF